MHTVCSNSLIIQKSCPIELFDRRTAITLPAVLVFRNRFRDMDTYRKIILSGKFRQRLIEIFRIQIDRMNQKTMCNKSITFIFNKLIKFIDTCSVDRPLPVHTFFAHGSLLNTEAGFYGAFGNQQRTVVHIGNASGTALDHLGQSQKIPVIEIIRDHFILTGNDLSEKPLLKRSVISDVSKDRHRRMAMRICKSRTKDLIIAVILKNFSGIFKSFRSFFLGRTDIYDLISRYRTIRMLDDRNRSSIMRRNDRYIRKENRFIHITPPNPRNGCILPAQK